MTIPDTVLANVSQTAHAVIESVSRVFVGPRWIPESLLVALVARGHVLLEGVPGVAKTTLVKAFASTLGGSFRRIQFTPDLLPTDITGTYVLDPRTGSFNMREGPIFANVVLGDEINRAPAKTQSALLEAMQERQVTIDGETRELPAPFIVLATQNPIEHAGTYPLPEAQIDRFLLRVIVGYPSDDEERAMIERFMRPAPSVQEVLRTDAVFALQNLANEVHVESDVVDYAVKLAAHTRKNAKVHLGISPRATLALVQAARARALLAGRAFVLPDDIKALALTVLAHRLVLAPEAEMEGVSKESVIQSALATVPHRQR